MIVDCYTHIWESPNQLGRLAKSLESGVSVPSGASEVDEASGGTELHLASSEYVDVSLVLGFRSHYLEADIPNDVVSAHVREHSGKFVGFAGIDPSKPGEALAEIDRSCDELGMKGIAIAPAAQDLHPCDSKAEMVYERAVERSLPVMFHPGIHLASECKLEYAQPVLLDEVARSYPDMKIVVAHMGYPWVNETLVLLAKHKNVFSDVSWLLHQPLEAYQALLCAHQYGVMNKLLFGSGFPYNSPARSIEALYGINHLCAGTNFPKIPREALRGIVERDALSLLGLPSMGTPGGATSSGSVLDEEAG